MATLEDALGSGANATAPLGPPTGPSVHGPGVFIPPEPGSASSVVGAAMKGLAGYYRNPNEDRNPKFDERARARSGAGGVKDLSKLYRGYITQMRYEVNPIPPATTEKMRQVRFQYNPTTISLNYSIDTNKFPDESRGSYDTAPVIAQSGQTMSFTLYFNRTYETLVGDKKVGVMADIQSLEYLMGSPGNGGAVAAVETLVCFGMTKSKKPLAFAGWISDLNVEFLQFTHRMIPTVAMVQVGMVRRLVSDSVDSSANSGGVVGEGFSAIKDIGTWIAAQSATSGRTAAPSRNGVTLPGPIARG